MLKTPVTDIFAHYLNSPVVPVFGGHLYQLRYVLDAICAKYPEGLKTYYEKKVENDDEDYFKRPNNLREICINDHMKPLIMQYLKDLKTECIEIMIDGVPAAFLKELGISFEDLSGLSDDNLGKFKELFLKEHRVSPIHDVKTSGQNFDTILDFAVDILARRETDELKNTTVKLDSITNKIVLVEMPEGTYMKDTKQTVVTENEDGTKNEEVVTHKANTNEKGVLLLKVPEVEKEFQEPLPIPEGKEEPEVDENGEVKTQTVKKMVEEDQNGKALAIQTREVQYLAEGANYFAINEYGGKAIREDFLDFIKSQFPEFFEENTDFEDVKAAANKQASADIQAYIKANCTEYDFPCMEFSLSAVEI